MNADGIQGLGLFSLQVPVYEIPRLRANTRPRPTSMASRLPKWWKGKESPTAAPTPAIVNAVLDAAAWLGVTLLDIHLSSMEVWPAI